MAKFTSWNPPKITPTRATYSWGNEQVDYAESVFFGAQYLNGARSFARPWTDAAVSEINLVDMFTQNYDGNLKNIGEAFKSTAKDLGEEFKRTIDFYDWGEEGSNRKKFKDSPTFKTITDSGDLRDSQRMEFNDD